MDLELLLFTMENILDELFNHVCQAEVFQDKDYDFIVVLNCGEAEREGEVSAIDKEFGIFVQYAKQYYGIEVSGSLSRPFQGIGLLRTAVEETGGMLEWRFFGETGTLSRYRNQEKQAMAVPEQFQMSVLEDLASQQDWHGVREFLKDFLSFLGEKTDWSPREVRSLLRKVYQILAVSFARCMIDIDNFEDRNGADLEAAIHDYTFYSRIRQSMMELFEQYVKEYRSNRGKGCRKEIVEVKSFVQTHMKEELSLPEIAAMVNMSESHFSHTFKKEIGISFVEYVYQIRIERAKHLLKTSISDFN